MTSGKQFEKLQSAAKKILDFHKLQDHCSAVLFESNEPTVFTYKLRSISFSTELLELLSMDEISALVAHEVGHLYLAKDLLQAGKENNLRMIRVVELKSDAVSLVTLKAIGLDPEVLISAIGKLKQAREKNGYEISREKNPSFNDRRALLDKYLKLKN
ncbi:MAG: M48 family metalloprotease [Aridibacter sp.]